MLHLQKAIVIASFYLENRFNEITSAEFRVRIFRRLDTDNRPTRRLLPYELNLAIDKAWVF